MLKVFVIVSQKDTINSFANYLQIGCLMKDLKFGMKLYIVRKHHPKVTVISL